MADILRARELISCSFIMHKIIKQITSKGSDETRNGFQNGNIKINPNNDRQKIR